MAKPSNTPATSKTSRRRMLQSFGYFLGSGAVVACAPSPAAAAAPLATQPTAYGRALLRMIAAHNQIIAKVNDPSISDDELGDGWADRSHRAYCDIEAFGREICARPVTSLSDLIDRAILAAWVCEADDDGRLHPIEDVNDERRFQAKLIESVLALAGIAPASCNSELAA